LRAILVERSPAIWGQLYIGNNSEFNMPQEKYPVELRATLNTYRNKILMGILQAE
jgi:hypothetical protein